MRMAVQIWVAKDLHMQGMMVEEEAVMLAAAESYNEQGKEVEKHLLVVVWKKKMVVDAEVNALHKVVVTVAEEIQ